MKKLYSIPLILLLIIIVFYLSGPKPDTPLMSNELPLVELSTNQLDSFLIEKEISFPVKPENESVILWNNDSIHQQMEYCVLYLHGFSASGYEGFPTHHNFANEFSANLYVPRLASHGLAVPEPLLDMTPDRLYESAKEALVIAQILGQKVIIVGTSTGGTLALKLAAEFPVKVHSLILLSPNIEINNPAAFLLSKPWGLQIARKVTGGKYRFTNDDLNADECKYWNCFYRLEATVYLQQLIESTMSPDIFERVKQPLFLGYYYQDEEHQDDVVVVDAMLKMFDQLGTPDELKEKHAFNAGTHVIGCQMFSKVQPEVEQACIDFAKNTLKMK
ncbi:alpha/beta hydrolase [Sunxiuqinia sp. A32]|uniref:alpha/beta hydrolase n=1 Tax=Sunxiuqinia sp. A32 TaxID=3461496 RepID=UPI004045A460